MNTPPFFKRQLPLLGEKQQTVLQKSSAAVVGLGGLGCPSTLYCALGGVGSLGLFDYDRVQVDNLHRQGLYDLGDVGKPKAETAGKRIREHTPWVQMETHSCRIDRNTVSLLDPYDVILDCTDNFAAKFLLHDYAYLNKKDLVQASVYQWEGQLYSFRFSQLQGQGCLRCLWPEIPQANCVRSCAESGILGAVTGVLGGMQAVEALQVLLKNSRKKPVQGIYMDLLQMEQTTLRWPQNPACPVCGNQGAKTIEALHPEGGLELYALPEKIDDYQIIDIREWDEVQESPLPLSTPVTILPSSTFPVESFSPEKPCILICSGGVRSLTLAEILQKKGVSQVYSLAGGIPAIPQDF